MKLRCTWHCSAILLCVLLPTVAPCIARGAAVQAGVVQTTSAVTRFEYAQLPVTAVFAEWNKLGSAGWCYFGTFGKDIIFRRDSTAAAHEQLAFAQLPLLSPLGDWNTMGSQGWQYVSVFQKAINFCRKVPAEGQTAPAPPETWEYTQLRPEAPAYEWNNLVEQGWLFAGEFMNVLVFKRTASGASSRFEYTQLPVAAVFAEWNKLGNAGWCYFGTFGKDIVFRRDNTTAHARLAFAQLPLLSPLSDWNTMGSQGWQYVSVFQKAINFCRKAPAEGQTAPAPEIWEYIQLRPEALAYEWNDLVEQGWAFAGEFMNALVFKRNAASASWTPAKTRSTWEYTQLPLAAFMYQWNELGEQGWEYASRFMQSIVFKRALAARNMSHVRWEYTIMPSASDFGQWSAVGGSGWEYADILDDKLVFKRKSTLGKK